MLVGMSITAVFIVAFNVVLPLVFNTVSFLPYAGIFLLPLVALIAYTVYKHHLFNIKAFAAQMLTFVLGALAFAEIIATHSVGEIIFRSFLLMCIVGAGVELTRSVNREVKQRELIEKQEHELELSNARLREVDKEKSEFLSFASHQLRTPLTAIRWSIDSIMDGTYGPLPDNLKGAMKTLIDESSGMAVMINDYLNVSRIEQGRMQYQFGPVDLCVLMNDVGTELRPGVEKKGLKLEISVPQEKVMVWGDSGKLKQIFGNIIDNATKYTPQGSITVLLRKMPGTAMAHVEIRDTGIGMTDDTLKHMFSKFSRGDNAAEVNNNGSGLGLFIVKTFIEAHHGTITAASEGVGKGTQFYVDIPLLVQPTA
jgi:signal transduction histidine kinase